MANRELSPQERAALFSQTTRQNFQNLPSVSATEGETISFNVPKVRLTSRIRLLVEATLNAVHSDQTSFTPAAFAPFSLIRKVQVDMNNGFSPFTLTGKELYLYSFMSNHAATLNRAESGRGKVVMGTKAASSSGADNVISFLADLPLTLNDRDPVGLIVTQNQETTVTVTVDIDSADKLLDNTTGYTLELKNITIQPLVESFSIPAIREAFPDISVIKLVQATKESISGAGLKTIALPTGTTYRRIGFLVEDNSGKGVSDSAITGNIELVFNQADIPYRVNSKQLAKMNHEWFGTVLPDGVWAFDFSYQGISGYGGARDYIDTERLTEFWLRFNASSAGSVTVVYETLSRLRQ